MSNQDSRLRLILSEMSNLYSNNNGNTTININFYDNYNYYNGDSPPNNIVDEELTEITATVSIPNNLSNVVTDSTSQLRQTVNNTAQDNRGNTNISGTTNNANNLTRPVVSRVIPLISSGNLSDILNNNLTDIISNVTNTLESNDSMAIFGQQIQPSSNNTNQLSIQQLNQNTNVFVTEDLQEKCSICNESFGDDPICRRNIICNHYFHRGCIDTWYSSHNKCPVCNINIVQN